MFKLSFPSLGQTLVFLLSFTILLCNLSNPAYAVLDNNFGGDGTVTYRPGIEGNWQEVATLSGGRLLAAGWFKNSATLDQEKILVLFNDDGTVDSSFSWEAAGDVLDRVHGTSCCKLAVQVIGGEEKILVAGAVGTIIGRLNIDGTIDTTFGSSGIYDLPVGVGFRDMAVSPSGSIFVLAGVGFDTDDGNKVIKLNFNGALDTTFGASGIASFNPDLTSFLNLVLQPDGKVIIVGVGITGTLSDGRAIRRIQVTRLNADGSVDSSFNNASLSGPPFDPYSSFFPRDVALQGGANILISGEYYCGDPSSAPYLNCAFLIRLNSAGRLDTSLGAGGLKTIPGSFVTKGLFSTGRPRKNL